MVSHKVLKRILFLILKIYCNVLTWGLLKKFILKTFKIVIDKLFFSSLFSFFFLHKIYLFFWLFLVFPFSLFALRVLFIEEEILFCQKRILCIKDIYIYIYIYFFRCKNGPYNSAKERKVSYWKEKSHLSEVNSLH